MFNIWFDCDFLQEPEQLVSTIDFQYMYVDCRV